MSDDNTNVITPTTPSTTSLGPSFSQSGGANSGQNSHGTGTTNSIQTLIPSVKYVVFDQHDIPKLQGYKEKKWIGIHTGRWLNLLENMFLNEGIQDERSKLQAVIKYITPESNAAFVYNAPPGVKNAQTFTEFKDYILAVLSSPAIKSYFDAYDNFKDATWDFHKVF